MSRKTAYVISYTLLITVIMLWLRWKEPSSNEQQIISPASFVHEQGVGQDNSSIEEKETTDSDSSRGDTHPAKISWYGTESCTNPGCFTASTEVFDGSLGTCACPDWYPFGTTFRVSYGDRSVIVKCNDRGAFVALGRFLDISKDSFRVLAPLSKGLIIAQVEVIN